MKRGRPVLVARILASAATAAMMVGCGAGLAVSRAPTEALEAADLADPVEGRWLGARCTVDDEPHALARKIAPRAGVYAQADASRVALSFTHQGSRRPLALAVDPQSLETVDEGASTPPRFVDEDRRDTLAGQTVPALWQPPPAKDDGVDLPVARDSDDSRTSRPVVARVDSERSVAVWNAGSIYAGEDVHVMMVDQHGASLGFPVTLASDGRAFGTPTVAVASSGRGVVAFMQSTDHGFDLVAVSIDCHAPAAPENRDAWAMRAGTRSDLN
jgi:hypothetical protein